MSVNLRNPFGKKETPDTNTVNPYLNARRSWNSHVGQIMHHSQVGIFVGLLGMLIGLAAVGGMTYIGSQSKFIPLVFQQDGSGNTISMTRPDRIPEALVDDYRTAVSDFITNIRLVTPDAELQNKAVLKTYGYLVPNDPATLKANEYLNATKETNPFTRAANEMVSVDVKSVLQQSKDTWQIDWQETVRGRDGSLKGAPYMMRALVTIYQNKDTEVEPEKMFINPHFIFVKDYNWSKQL
ncbi:conjugal transfer protein TrbF (plasmid) [Xylella fastidiosa]|uniref:conjugal transfer protein TrbF n=1 Tax=Xylella fastidiosa TaxID=2371 RepID=UPI000765B201|nr:conjugal transfer protein TrbF [Xylella fastidiosa]KXB09744.1 conjugal transfer protein TrbF [Xylella fastidiosa]KXB13376.1 conjugal transfer protein TrbF [Xylella fastidiosa]